MLEIESLETMPFWTTGYQGLAHWPERFENTHAASLLQLLSKAYLQYVAPGDAWSSHVGLGIHLHHGWFCAVTPAWSFSKTPHEPLCRANRRFDSVELSRSRDWWSTCHPQNVEPRKSLKVGFQNSQSYAPNLTIPKADTDVQLPKHREKGYNSCEGYAFVATRQKHFPPLANGHIPTATTETKTHKQTESV